MRKIPLTKARILLSDLASHPTAAIRYLAASSQIGKSTVAVMLKQIEQDGRPPLVLKDCPDAELEQVFGTQSRRLTTFIEPDWAAVFDYLKSKTAFNRRWLLCNAWMYVYIQHAFPACYREHHGC